jgi:hypothetical protein
MMCVFCNREVSFTTRHHLIPKTTHSKKKIRKRFPKERRVETIDVCCDCHKTIHKFIPEMQLATEYNSLDLLLSHPELQNFKIWIVKQREGIV